MYSILLFIIILLCVLLIVLSVIQEQRTFTKFEKYIVIACSALPTLGLILAIIFEK